MPKNNKLNQNGFHLLLLLVFLLVFGVVGTIGYVIFTNNKNKSNAEVRWSYDDKKDEWFVKQGTAPPCKEPYVFDKTPVDLTSATSVLFAGTYRAKSYKVHGGFGLSKSSQVVLPADATLSGITRYYEGDPLELQYMVNFETDCGIAFYFDHLHTLAPQLQELAEKLPEPKVNDTRTSPDDAPPRIKMKAGDTVATETGAHKVQRYGIDFGVVDYRQRNKISKNSAWTALHGEYKATEWYGVCWYDMLPGDDAEKAKQLSLAQVDTRRTAQHVSDYCDNADHTTLDFNNGQPADQY
jgi:hypothetical protein